MRRAANLGPATPRDIYEALVKGGLKFDTTVVANAITGVRGTLRKNSSIFHKLPNGEYGLLSWYPRAKAARPNAAADDESGAAASEDDS
jgi:hypothetical protein